MSGVVFPNVHPFERPWNKPAVDKAVVEYLAWCGAHSNLLSQVQNELADLVPPASSDCKLVRLFRYATDGSVEVAVSRLSGETDKFEVYQWTTVRELKDLIEDRLNIPICEQQLLRCGRQLKNESECLAASRVTFSSTTLELLRVEVQDVEENLEVLLTRATNIPEGSIVSIRAGNARRQAPLNFDQSFKFPLKKDAANPFKINIYSQFGKARLVLRNDEDTYLAQIEGEDGSCVGSLEFEAKDSSGQERRRRSRMQSQPSTVAAKAKKSVVVSRYLDEHGLIEYMQSLIQSVMHEQPKDPFQYMIRQLQAAIDKRRSAPDSSGANQTGREASEESSGAPDSSGANQTGREASEERSSAPDSSGANQTGREASEERSSGSDPTRANHTGRDVAAAGASEGASEGRDDTI